MASYQEKMTVRYKNKSDWKGLAERGVASLRHNCFTSLASLKNDETTRSMSDIGLPLANASFTWEDEDTLLMKFDREWTQDQYDKVMKITTPDKIKNEWATSGDKNIECVSWSITKKE